MISLKEKINNFLYCVGKIRRSPLRSIERYENLLLEILRVGQFYDKDEKYIWEIMPLGLKIIDDSKNDI
jgi:hypothetical protein